MSIESEEYLKAEEQKKLILSIEKEAIAEYVAKVGCTYASEVSRATLIPKERAVGLIYALMKEHKIYRLRLNPTFVPEEMKPRLHEFWCTGIHGFEMFSKYIWLIPEPQKPHKYEGGGIPANEEITIYEETVE